MESQLAKFLEYNGAVMVAMTPVAVMEVVRIMRGVEVPSRDIHMDYTMRRMRPAPIQNKTHWYQDN